MIQPHSPGSIDYLELVGVGSHPTFTQLRGEGLSRTAIETLLLSHDALDAGMSPDAVADFIRDSQDAYPVTVADVYPHGAPCRCETWGLAHCLPHRDHDGAPQHQWEALVGQGWSERNAQVMRVVAGIESGQVA